MDIVSLAIQLISGALGGNLAGSLLKNLSLGTVGNSLAGIIGGGLGGQILERAMALPPVHAGLDVGTIVTQVAGGGVGGALLMVVIGVLRRAFAK